MWTENWKLNSAANSTKLYIVRTLGTEADFCPVTRIARINSTLYTSKQTHLCKPEVCFPDRLKELAND